MVLGSPQKPGKDGFLVPRAYPGGTKEAALTQPLSSTPGLSISKTKSFKLYEKNWLGFYLELLKVFSH
jgi:hypothetical protein